MNCQKSNITINIITLGPCAKKKGYTLMRKLDLFFLVQDILSQTFLLSVPGRNLASELELQDY